MTIIYTQSGSLPNYWFSQYSPTSTSFEHSFNIQPELLEYKLIDKDDDTTIIHINLSLAEMQQASRFYSQTMFAVNNSAIKLDGSLVSLKGSDLTSLFQNTLPNKSDSLQNDVPFNKDTMVLPFRIFVTSATANFTEFKYHLAKPQGEGSPNVTVNTNNTATYNSTPIKWKDLVDQLTLSTSQSNITAGDTILVNVQSTNTKIDYVYLEQVCGILNKTKVKMVNGIGSFSILTDALSSGDAAEIKCGYKLYTGVDTFTKPIL